jgi:hypothetical protein
VTGGAGAGYASCNAIGPSKDCAVGGRDDERVYSVYAVESIGGHERNWSREDVFMACFSLMRMWFEFRVEMSGRWMVLCRAGW